jgi:hypothetical protein
VSSDPSGVKSSVDRVRVGTRPCVSLDRIDSVTLSTTVDKVRVFSFPSEVGSAKSLSVHRGFAEPEERGCAAMELDGRYGDEMRWATFAARRASSLAHIALVAARSRGDGMRRGRGHVHVAPLPWSGNGPVQSTFRMDLNRTVPDPVVRAPRGAWRHCDPRRVANSTRRSAHRLCLSSSAQRAAGEWHPAGAAAATRHRSYAIAAHQGSNPAQPARASDRDKVYVVD